MAEFGELAELFQGFWQRNAGEINAQEISIALAILWRMQDCVNVAKYLLRRNSARQSKLACLIQAQRIRQSLQKRIREVRPPPPPERLFIIPRIRTG